jgi:hypothetical protein
VPVTMLSRLFGSYGSFLVPLTLNDASPRADPLPRLCPQRAAFYPAAKLCSLPQAIRRSLTEFVNLNPESMRDLEESKSRYE